MQFTVCQAAGFNDHQSIGECRRKLENCVFSVQRWCGIRLLQRNADKSELVWFGSAANMQRLQTLDTEFILQALSPPLTLLVLTQCAISVYLDSRHACPH